MSLTKAHFLLCEIESDPCLIGFGKFSPHNCYIHQAWVPFGSPRLLPSHPRNKTRNLRSRDQQIQQARIINLFKRGFEEKKEELGVKISENSMSIQTNVEHGSVLYRFRGVTTKTITCHPTKLEFYLYHIE